MSAERADGAGVVVVLASNNAGKLAELRCMLPGWVSVVSAAEAGVAMPDETGATFTANALLKARAAASQSGLISLADDSGLEVDALNGAPGVRSARFAGEPANDTANNALLLRRLASVPAHARTARFRSAIAVVLPDGNEHVAEGTVQGFIVREPRGTGGFGYDPLFQIEDTDRTMAELTIDEKSHVSHRGRAFRRAAQWLIPLLEQTRTNGDPVRGGAEG